MKKKIFKLLTGMLLSCALAGSTVAVQAEEAGTDTVKSYLTGEEVSSRATSVVSMIPPRFSSRRICKNKSLYVIAIRRRKVRLTPFPPAVKTSSASLLLLFLPQTLRRFAEKVI